MEVEKGTNKQQPSRHSWLASCTKCFPVYSSKASQPPPPPEKELAPEKDRTSVLPSSKTTKRKPGGWKAMPFVFGNETFERLATYGLVANFMIFLLTQFHMEQASAANLINIWNGVNYFTPLIGAFIADAYVGRFWTIGFASFASLLGMMALTLIAWIPQLRPPKCSPGGVQQLHHCKGANAPQMGVLSLALGFLSIGTGGIRPCSLPFGVDQFDATTEEGKKGINSFFNWYYTTFALFLILAFTVVVYVQDNVSWVVGFGIPTGLMVCSILLFFIGTRVYVYVKPEGNMFSGIGQVFVAAYRKRKLKLPGKGEVEDHGLFYDPPLLGTRAAKLSLTDRFRFLNKAAIVLEYELNPDGSRSNPWRLCTIQQVEEAKCMLKVVPVWAAGIISSAPVAQQSTFTVSQALKTDRLLGPHFQIPAGSLVIISLLTIGLWLPFYDRIVVPRLRKFTGLEGGITLLQRMGIGLVLSVLSMIVAGFVERMRRASAIAHGRPDGIAPLSVLWLAPQLSLMGFGEAFSFIGQIEFYHKEFPENMSSVANALFYCTVGGGSYLSSLLITIVHGTTGGHGRPDWLTADINSGRVDYFYFLIAGLGFMNLVYFLVVSRGYRYKEGIQILEERPQFDVEMTGSKH